jgi:hypothetical protein
MTEQQQNIEASREETFLEYVREEQLDYLREERLSLIREIVEKSDNPKDLIVDEVDVEYIQADFFSDLGSDINRRISSHLMEMEDTDA